MSAFSRIGFFLLGWIAVTPLSLHGGPLAGPFVREIEVQGTKTFQETFRGGQRACFIALAVGKQPHTITVTVYDAQDKVVGSDDGKRTAVIWYPPRDAEYRIEIRSSSTEERVCYIAVK